MRAVQVGAGTRGSKGAAMLDKLGALGAVCDVDGAAACAKKHGVAHYSSLGEMVGSADFGAAMVSVPVVQCHGIVHELLCAKKHVLVDGAISNSSGGAKQLAQLAQKNGVMLASSNPARFGPATSVAEKRYGGLQMLSLDRKGARPRNMQAGVIHGLAVPDICAANWLFGEAPSVVFARAGGDQGFASITLSYMGGRTATITARWAGAEACNFHASCSIEDYAYPGPDGDLRGAEAGSFLGAAAGGKPHPSTPGEAVDAAGVAEAALLSSQKGIPIYLDLR